MSSLFLLFANAMNKSKQKKKSEESSTPKTIDLTMCRICNAEKGDVPIFHNLIQPNVSEEIFNFSGVTVSEMDNFPQNMCQSCLDLLNGCIIFRDMCQKTNREMLELSIKKESNIKQESEEYFKIVDADFSAPPLFSDSPNELEYPTDNSKICDSKTYYDIPLDESLLKDCKKPQRRRRKKKDKECDREQNEILKRQRRPRQKKEQECDKTLKGGKKPPRRRRTYVYKFLCDTCGKVCQSIGQLQTHMTTHKNVFPFKCDVCPYRGRTDSLLKVHKRSHLADKPYKCTQCPKATTTASNLARHMACFHSATKPNCNFKCDYCDKTFIYRYRMRRHIEEIHLKTASAECDICFKTYTNKKSLLRHRSTAHNLKRKTPGGRLPSYLLVQQDATATQENMAPDDYNQHSPKHNINHLSST